MTAPIEDDSKKGPPHKRNTLPCGEPRCRAYRLTMSEFEALQGAKWSQSFRVKLAGRAKELHSDLYGRKPPKVRDPLWASYRNMVCQYPCGILEQAYRELKERERSTLNASAKRRPDR
jgi:hypothetical protein